MRPRPSGSSMNGTTSRKQDHTSYQRHLHLSSSFSLLMLGAEGLCAAFCPRSGLYHLNSLSGTGTKPDDHQHHHHSEGLLTRVNFPPSKQHMTLVLSSVVSRPFSASHRFPIRRSLVSTLSGAIAFPSSFPQNLRSTKNILPPYCLVYSSLFCIFLVHPSTHSQWAVDTFYSFRCILCIADFGRLGVSRRNSLLACFARRLSSAYWMRYDTQCCYDTLRFLEIPSIVR